MNDRPEDEVWAADTGVTLQSLVDDPACPALLSRVLTGIHSWQIRNETTVGRTLKASQLMPEWVAALLALGASVTVEDDGGPEDVALETVIRRQVKGDVKMLHVPCQADIQWGEARVARTPSDDPIVAVFAVVRVNQGVVEEARVTLTGVSSQPVWLAEASSGLVGQDLTETQIRDISLAIEDEVQPEGDYLGSEEYRRAMAGVLTRRALEACAAGLAAGGSR